MKNESVKLTKLSSLTLSIALNSQKGIVIEIELQEKGKVSPFQPVENRSNIFERLSKVSVASFGCLQVKVQRKCGLTSAFPNF